MARIELGYGNRQIPFEYDPTQFEVLNPLDVSTNQLTDADLNDALDHPIGTARLEEIIESNQRVVIVVPDATRSAGAHRVAPLIVERLNQHGVSDDKISVLIGGGTHRAPTKEETDWILGAELPTRIAIHAHDARDSASHVNLGSTSRGTRVSLNRRLVETDHVIAIGAISYHYIAGFSGGRKAILPGCAAEHSIKSSHLNSFDLNSLEKCVGVASGRLDGNPVHEDMTEACALLNPSFLLNTVIRNGEVVAVYAGHWREAHRRGCDEYHSKHSVPACERRPLVIVSAGGRPRDINLIQSHKAMEHASEVLEDNGVMVVLAECPDGLGRNDFLQWFVPGGSSATAEMLVNDYHIYGQTAWGLRRKAERFCIQLFSSIDELTVRRLGLECRGIKDTLSVVSNERGYIIPSGLTTLPVLP